jgi:hypothetical protein
MAGITPVELIVLLPLLLAVALVTLAGASSLVTPGERLRLMAATLLLPGVGPFACLVFLAVRRRRASVRSRG